MDILDKFLPPEIKKLSNIAIRAYDDLGVRARLAQDGIVKVESTVNDDYRITVIVEDLKHRPEIEEGKDE
ncbi:hypothetical protein [uncultured Methanocorpusculum sp.]|nr:hypothetical protein [uncultured Methanocorpusculum sp.]